mgnify:CR=1 FL=1
MEEVDPTSFYGFYYHAFIQDLVQHCLHATCVKMYQENTIIKFNEVSMLMMITFNFPSDS